MLLVLLVSTSVRLSTHLPTLTLANTPRTTAIGYRMRTPMYTNVNATGRKPTSSTSEAKVNVAEGSMPWQQDNDGGDARDHFKYKYHPGGDPRNPPKDAPSALHSVIVPNVNLPKVCYLWSYVNLLFDERFVVQ